MRRTDEVRERSARIRPAAAVTALLLAVSCAAGTDSRRGDADRSDRDGTDPGRDAYRDDRFDSGGYIVLLRKGADPGTIRRCLGDYLPVLIRKSVTENMYLVKFGRDPGTGILREAIQGCEGIAGISRNARPGPDRRGR